MLANILRRFVFAGLIMAVLAAATITVAQAWDCTAYNFRVQENGTVQVENRSGVDEAAQQADVYIRTGGSWGTRVARFNVPFMPRNTGWQTIGTITPPTVSWEWWVDGTVDCEDKGEYKIKTPTPTVTPSKTPTNTPTNTPTKTLTPSNTATNTPTRTPTNCNGPSPWPTKRRPTSSLPTALSPNTPPPPAS